MKKRLGLFIFWWGPSKKTQKKTEKKYVLSSFFCPSSTPSINLQGPFFFIQGGNRTKKRQGAFFCPVAPLNKKKVIPFVFPILNYLQELALLFFYFSLLKITYKDL